jgi:hypothetical protein
LQALKKGAGPFAARAFLRIVFASNDEQGLEGLCVHLSRTRSKEGSKAGEEGKEAGKTS